MKEKRVAIGSIIADNIRAERNRSKMTQLEVSSVLEVSLKTYQTYEQNAKNVEAPILLFLANIFHCSINDFYLNINFTKCEFNQEKEE